MLASSVHISSVADVRYRPAGKNFLRDDNVTPEEAASGNIAKAQQSSGNAIDSIKCVLPTSPAIVFVTCMYASARRTSDQPDMPTNE